MKMVKFYTWLIVVSITLCLARSEDLETLKEAKATVVKDDNKQIMAASSTTQRVVVISEKTLAEISQQSGNESNDAKKKEVEEQKQNPKTEAPQQSKIPNEYDIDLENSVRTGFYLLMTISVGALLFVGWKINKLRLSRAERKYGVQGDRTTQELAPLPLSMEDIDSDEEDQTIFDAHRHQIRIF